MPTLMKAPIMNLSCDSQGPEHPVLKALDERLFELYQDIQSPLKTTMILGYPTYTRWGQGATQSWVSFCKHSERLETYDVIYAPMAHQASLALDALIHKLKDHLRPRGCLILSTFLRGSLCELNKAILQAQILCDRGVSPRVHHFESLSTWTSALHTQGFCDVVGEQDTITLHYKNFRDILKELSQTEGRSQFPVHARPHKNFWSTVKAHYASVPQTSSPWPLSLELGLMSAWKA